MPRAIEFFLIDILLSIDRINRLLVKIPSPDHLMKEEFACNSILRDLEIMGEAMNRVLSAKHLSHLVNPDWRRVVGFRNIVVHEYFGLDYEEVFRIASIKVPILEQEIITLIKQLPERDFLAIAFGETKTDLKLIRRTHSYKYLTRIEKQTQKKQSKTVIKKTKKTRS